MRIMTCSICLILSLFTGCSKKSIGFTNTMPEENDTTKVQKTITDEEIAKVLELRPQIAEKMKIAVYYRSLNTFRYYYEAPFTWRVEDKQVILSIADSDIGKERIADIIPIEEIDEKITVKNIRLEAAKYGADAVIIVRPRLERKESPTPLAFTYFALLPMAFIPATKVESYFSATATMYDVRNGFVYFSTESASTKHKNLPLIFAFSPKLQNVTKDSCLSELKHSIEERLRRK